MTVHMYSNCNIHVDTSPIQLNFLRTFLYHHSIKTSRSEWPLTNIDILYCATFKDLKDLEVSH